MSMRPTHQSDEIAALCKQGLRYTAVARRFGVSRQRVYQIAERTGCPKRNRKRPVDKAKALLTIAELDAASRQRALTDTESRMLERAIKSTS